MMMALMCVGGVAGAFCGLVAAVFFATPVLDAVALYFAVTLTTAGLGILRLLFARPNQPAWTEGALRFPGRPQYARAAQVGKGHKAWS